MTAIQLTIPMMPKCGWWKWCRCWECLTFVWTLQSPHSCADHTIQLGSRLDPRLPPPSTWWGGNSRNCQQYVVMIIIWRCNHLKIKLITRAYGSDFPGRVETTQGEIVGSRHQGKCSAVTNLSAAAPTLTQAVVSTFPKITQESYHKLFQPPRNIKGENKITGEYIWYFALCNITHGCMIYRRWKL